MNKREKHKVSERACMVAKLQISCKTKKHVADDVAYNERAEIK